MLSKTLFDKATALFLTFLLTFTMFPWMRIEQADARVIDNEKPSSVSVYQHEDAANYGYGGKGAKKLSEDPVLSVSQTDVKYGDTVTFEMKQTNVDWSGKFPDGRPSNGSANTLSTHSVTPFLSAANAGESILGNVGRNIGIQSAADYSSGEWVFSNLLSTGDYRIFFTDPDAHISYYTSDAEGALGTPMANGDDFSIEDGHYFKVVSDSGFSVVALYTVKAYSNNEAFGTVTVKDSNEADVPEDTLILSNTEITFKAIPASIDYEFKYWKDAETGQVISEGSTYWISGFNSDIEMVAVFEAASKPVTFGTVAIEPGGERVSGAGGSVSATVGGESINSGDEVPIGTDVVFTATPAPSQADLSISYYRFLGWQVDNSEQLVQDGTIPQKSTGMDVRAVFEHIVYTVEATADHGLPVYAKVGDQVVTSVPAGTSVTFYADEFGGEHNEWTFAEWNINGMTTTDRNPSYTVTSANVTAHATYVAHNTTITAKQADMYATPRGTFTITDATKQQTSTTGSLDVQYGDSVTITATPAAGYTFLRWEFSDGREPQYSPTVPAFTVTGSVVATAYFEKDINVSVICQPVNGGSASYTPNDVHENDDVTFTAVPAEGYHFKYWAHEAAPDTPIGTELTWTEQATEANSNIQLRAVFEKNITVHTDIACFDSKSSEAVSDPSSAGTITSSTDVIVPGQPYTVTATPNSGYSFKGWYYASDPTHAIIPGSTGESYTFPAADVSIVAKFELDHYSVSFDLGADPLDDQGYAKPTWASGQPGPIDVTVRTETITVPGASAFNPADYVYNGWLGANSDRIQAGQENDHVLSTPITSDVVYTAQWTPKPLVTATFNTHGGEPAIAKQTVIQGHKVTMPTPDQTAISGYYLVGWDDVEGNQIKHECGKEVAITEDSEFHAVWAANAATNMSMSIYIPTTPAFFEVLMPTAKIQVQAKGSSQWNDLPESAGEFSYSTESNMLTFTFTQDYLDNVMPYAGETYKITVDAKTTTDGSLLKGNQQPLTDYMLFPEQHAVTLYDGGTYQTQAPVQVKELLPVMDVQKSVRASSIDPGAASMNANALDYVNFTLVVSNTNATTKAHDVIVTDTIPSSLANSGVEFVNDSSHPMIVTKNGASTQVSGNPLISGQSLRFVLDDVDLTGADTIEVSYWMHVGDENAAAFKQILSTSIVNEAVADAQDDNGNSYAARTASAASATVKVMEPVLSMTASVSPEVITGAGGSREAVVTASVSFASSPDDAVSIINPTILVQVDTTHGASIVGDLVVKTAGGSTVVSVPADGSGSYVLPTNRTFAKTDELVVTYSVSAPKSTATNTDGISTSLQAGAVNSTSAPVQTINVGVKLPNPVASTKVSTALPNAGDTVRVTHVIKQTETGASMTLPTLTLKDVTSRNEETIEYPTITKYTNLKVTKASGAEVPFTQGLPGNGSLVITLGEDISDEDVTVEYDDVVTNSPDANLTDTSVSIEVYSINAVTTAASATQHYVVQEPTVQMSEVIVTPLDESGDPAVVNVGDVISYELTVIQSPNTARSTGFSLSETVVIYDEHGSLLDINDWPSATPYFVKNVKIEENGVDVTDQYTVTYTDAHLPDLGQSPKPTMFIITGNASSAHPEDLSGTKELKVTYSMAAGDSSSRTLKGMSVASAATFKALNLTKDVTATVAQPSKIADAALAIDKSANASEAKQGDVVGYTVTVKNVSDGSSSIAKNVVVVDQLDESAVNMGYRIDAQSIVVKNGKQDITAQSKVTWDENGFTLETNADLAKSNSMTLTYKATTAEIPDSAYSASLVNTAFARSDNAAIVATSAYVDYTGKQYVPGGESDDVDWYNDPNNPANGSNGSSGGKSSSSASGDVNKTGDTTLYMIAMLAITSIAVAGAVFLVRRRSER